MNESCKDIVDLIPLYIDNVLEDDINSKVKEHIKHCKYCNQEFLFLSKISKSFQEIPDVSISENFHKNLMARVAEQQAKKRARRIVLLRRSGAGVAAAAVVALSVVGFSNLSTTKTDIDSANYSVVPTSDTISVPVDETTSLIQSKESAAPVAKTEEKAGQDISYDSFVDENTAPSGGGSTAKDISAASPSLPADDIVGDVAAICEDLTCMKAAITLNDTNRDAVMEILSQYEKDEIGYLIPDINKVLRKIAELGIHVQTETCEFTHNYIIIN